MKEVIRILIFIFYGLTLFFMLSCKRHDNAILPILTTVMISDVTQTSAISGGDIESDGGVTILTQGVCWSTGQSPSITANKTSDSIGISNFKSKISGLTANTVYYLRAYATNSYGTAYGNQISFSTLADNQIVDIEGNIYNTVKIGNQEWTVENLRTTKLNDGTIIPNMSDSMSWKLIVAPAYCWLRNDLSNKDKYGALYNWYVVNTGKLCPKGWHVPTDAEWTILENYLLLNGYNFDGTTTGNKYAKALASASGWLFYAGLGTVGNFDYPTKQNATGFSALPAGYRVYWGEFISDIGCYGTWWTSTEYCETSALSRNVTYRLSQVSTFTNGKTSGFSIRCIRD